MCLQAYLDICVSPPALTQKIGMSNSRAVIQYVERPHMTYSFQVTSVDKHNMSYQKVVAIHVCLDP